MPRKHQLTSGCALSDAGATTIANLPEDLVATHVLRHVRDPLDLARLSAVSQGMRDAVNATGREITETTDPFDAESLGFLTTLRLMHSRGRLKSAHRYMLCNAAAVSGQFEELKALRAKNWPWNEKTCEHAAKGGQLEILKWLRANGCPWNKWTCAEAEGNGHLEVLKWLRDNGCPWDEYTCSHAAARGHLEVLKWARANGCPWDERTRKLAASIGYVET